MIWELITVIKVNKSNHDYLFKLRLIVISKAKYLKLN